LKSAFHPPVRPQSSQQQITFAVERQGHWSLAHGALESKSAHASSKTP
jgi:hypothetical protein